MRKDTEWLKFLDEGAALKLRKKMKLSQVEFAKRLGVHHRTVAAWEYGLNMPSKVNCEKLADLKATCIKYR